LSYAPRVRPYAVAPFVGPWSIHGQSAISYGTSGPASATWPAASRAYYYPIVLPAPCTIYRFFWLNGATVGTNNFQVGIYNDNDAGTDGPGTAILRGTSTLSAGANICQFDNVTDTAIDKGRYWLALWGSGTTATIFRISGTASVDRARSGYLESGIAGGLPATATPAQNTTPYVPVFGFTTVSAP
jgi:hypothetical protein